MYFNELIVNVDGNAGRITGIPPTSMNSIVVKRGSYARTSLSKSVTAGVVAGLEDGFERGLRNRFGGYGSVRRSYIDTNNYYYWESALIPPKNQDELNDMRALVRAVTRGKDTTVRLKSASGSYYDFKLSENQKTALARTWRYYELLSGPKYSSQEDQSTDTNSKINAYIEELGLSTAKQEVENVKNDSPSVTSHDNSTNDTLFFRETQQDSKKVDNATTEVGAEITQELNRVIEEQKKILAEQKKVLEEIKKINEAQRKSREQEEAAIKRTNDAAREWLINHYMDLYWGK